MIDNANGRTLLNQYKPIVFANISDLCVEMSTKNS